MCLATDLGMGFPFEHGLQATMVTMRLAESLDVDAETRARTYYASLLMYAGCTVDELERSEIFGGNMTEHHTHRQFGSRAEGLAGVMGALPEPGAGPLQKGWQIARGLPRASRFISGHLASLCEVAGMLAQRLGMPEEVTGMFPLLTERWDGKSGLRRARGEEIPLPLRIIHVGRDAAYQRLVGDGDYVLGVVNARSGGAFDPDIVSAFLDGADNILGPADAEATLWDDVLEAEPKPRRILEGQAVEEALKAMGSFADLVSHHLTGHSSGVADLAGRAAELHGFEAAEVRAIRMAGFVHDIGRTAVPSKIWNKAGPLSSDEWEQARLHPYHTERVLSRSTYLAEVRSIAMAHHERIDGSGYHRGVGVASLPPASRLLAAADAFRSKVEPRPYRDALTPEEATEMLVSKAREGAYDPSMVEAVSAAAGQTIPTIPRPGGLTEREVEVVRLLARGKQTKQIATELRISPKTADRHIQNSYRKMGVSSRAAATLFASENGLISP